MNAEKDIKILQSTQKRLDDNDTSFDWSEISFEHPTLDKMRENLNKAFFSDCDIQHILNILCNTLYDLKQE